MHKHPARASYKVDIFRILDVGSKPFHAASIVNFFTFFFFSFESDILLSVGNMRFDCEEVDGVRLNINHGNVR